MAYPQWFFIDDIATALSLTHDQVDVLFIKPTGLDAVHVSFRFLATVDGATTDRNVTKTGADASWIGKLMSDLHHQVSS